MRKNILRGARNGFVALCIAAAILGTPVLLFAHARLVRSTPAAGSTLTISPTELQLWFSESPELKFSAIVLTDSAGLPVPLGAVSSIGGNGLRAPIIGALAVRKYIVNWKTAASDGHATSGSFTFTVAPSTLVDTVRAAAGATPLTPGASITVQIDSSHRRPRSNAPIAPAQDAPFSTAMRWAELVALLTLIGVVTFRLAVVTGAKWEEDLANEANDRLVRFARAVLVLFAVATLTRGMAQSQMISSSTSRMSALMTLVQDTNWGHAWGIGIIGVVITLVGLIAAGRSLGGWIATGLGLIAAVLGESLTGHSGAVKHYSAAIAADVAHVLGAGGWLGGLVAMVMCASPVLKRLDSRRAADAGSRLLKAYHGAATECVTIVVASAVLSMWTRFPTLSAIWTSPYGQMLLRKTFFVVVVMGFGLYHWRKMVLPAWNDDTRFRFQRTAVGELLFGAVVVAFTALLITMPLP